MLIESDSIVNNFSWKTVLSSMISTKQEKVLMKTDIFMSFPLPELHNIRLEKIKFHDLQLSNKIFSNNRQTP